MRVCVRPHLLARAFIAFLDTSSWNGGCASGFASAFHLCDSRHGDPSTTTSRCSLGCSQSSSSGTAGGASCVETYV